MVAEGIVDLLETVKVEEQQRKARVVALGDQQAGVHLVEEHCAVGQPGEGVVGGEVVDALLRGFAFRDIGDGQDDAP